MTKAQQRQQEAWGGLVGALSWGHQLRCLPADVGACSSLHLIRLPRNLSSCSAGLSLEQTLKQPPAMVHAPADEQSSGRGEAASTEGWVVPKQ